MNTSKDLSQQLNRPAAYCKRIIKEWGKHLMSEYYQRGGKNDRVVKKMKNFFY